MRAWIVVVLCSGCIVSRVGTFGEGKSRQQVVHEQAAQLTPTRIKPTGSWTGAIATKKVRVYADEEHRSQHLRWQPEFQAILDDANDILAPQFGIKFVAEMVSWQYRAPAATALDDTLKELQQHDPGTDVFAVIALTSSLPMVSDSFDQIGVAYQPGRHLVIRGYSDVRERAAMEAYFEDLTKSERDLMFEARKHHKRLSLLLHELGHAFGAGHAGVPSSVMTPSYSIQATQFDEASRSAIIAQLDQRLGRKTVVENAPIAVAEDTPVVVKKAREPLKLDPNDKTPVIVIEVDADGQRTLNGKPVPDAQLDGVFLLAADKSKQTRVYIRTEPGTPVDAVNAIAERARRSGLAKVIVTDD